MAEFVRQVDPTEYELAVADGATTTAALDLGGRVLCGAFLPASFEGTTLQFTAAPTPAGTYVPVTNEDGTNYEVTIAASKYVMLDPRVLAGLRFVKPVVGTAQTGANTITLVAR